MPHSLACMLSTSKVGLDIDVMMLNVTISHYKLTILVQAAGLCTRRIKRTNCKYQAGKT